MLYIYVQGRLLCWCVRLGKEEGCLCEGGGNCLKYRGLREKKIKKGGASWDRGGCLKRGGTGNSSQTIYTTYTLIEKVTKTVTTTEHLGLLLKKWENFWILKWKTLYPMAWTKNLTTFRSSFTVIFRSVLGMYTFVIGSRNVTTTTTELLKNVIYVTSDFPIVSVIHKY